MVTVRSSIKIVNIIITIEENTKNFIALQIHNNILKYRKFPKKIKIETNKKNKGYKAKS